MPRMTGARFIAETFKSYGITHAFYMEIILPRALAEMEKLGIRRIVTHSEKGAAYMADGYARLAQKPGLCMAQSVGAASFDEKISTVRPRASLRPSASSTGSRSSPATSPS